MRPSASETHTELPREPSPGCRGTHNKHKEDEGILPEPVSILSLGPTVSVTELRGTSWSVP
eukprot:2472184-Pyramimonas_sp.AAC.1